MATCTSILAWEIAWTEEPGGLQSMGVKKSWTQPRGSALSELIAVAVSELLFALIGSVQVSFVTPPWEEHYVVVHLSSVLGRTKVSSFFNETLLPLRSCFLHTLVLGPEALTVVVVITGLGLGAALPGPLLPSLRELHWMGKCRRDTLLRSLSLDHDVKLLNPSMKIAVCRCFSLAE